MLVVMAVRCRIFLVAAVDDFAAADMQFTRCLLFAFKQ